MPPTTAVTPKQLLHEGTPAQIREALVEEDREAFDVSYRRALDTAAQTYSLDELDKCLEHWRRTAAMQADMGPERWRKMLAKADYLNQHRQPPPGTRTYTAEESREMVRARLAAAEA